MKVLPRLTQTYGAALPELVVPWQAATFPDPSAVVIDDVLARDLGYVPEELRDDPSVLVGVSEGAGPAPVAMAYAGHQFGMYVPRLGDGRALLLGEAELTDESGQGRLVDVHLKGSGPTPFARGGDGFATLGPMLREYLVSGAMHALGIPTSRSLAVVTTGARVRRETLLPGAVLTRVASSHIRVGTFQLARGNEDVLRRLADYSISRHYPDLEGDYLGFYRAVIAAQASLIASWMGVGFIHGVMNTDNTTISGETIDYGPCAFLDAYDPGAVFSSIDHHGRYAYHNQGAIAQWNLARLGEALLPLLEGPEGAQDALSSFSGLYDAAWADTFAKKIGLPASAETTLLAQEFLDLLARERLDFTDSFRRLGEGEAPSDSAETAQWLVRWRERSPDTKSMARVNPVFIPRNFVLQRALDEAVAGDFSRFHELLGLVTDPYTPRPAGPEYTQGGPAGFQTFCGT